MIYLIGCEKGGTGKTTLATNLATHLKLGGSDVLLLDTDKQGSANSWAGVREELEDKERFPEIPSVHKFGNKVYRTILDLAEKFDDIVVDAVGKDSVELRSALTVADYALMPLQASQFDIWTLAATDHILEAAKTVNHKLIAKIVISRASTNPSVSEVTEARSLFEEMNNASMCETVVKERIAYRKAARYGLAIFEMDTPDLKAVEELNNLFKEMTNE